MDGDLLINGCDDLVLKDQFGMLYKNHRRKLLRLISGEFSAEDVFKKKSSKPANPKHSPRPENWEQSHFHAQKQVEEV